MNTKLKNVGYLEDSQDADQSALDSLFGPSLDGTSIEKAKEIFQLSDELSNRESDATIKVSALDVAEYILRKTGSVSTMKLQKLVYYCQVWSLVWDEKPLFFEEIEAWANGPVIRELFNFHRGRFEIDHISTGNPELLSDEQKETIDAVLNFYSSKTAQWLVELSHNEKPWKDARRGLSETERGSRIIRQDSMAEYYSSL